MKTWFERQLAHPQHAHGETAERYVLPLIEFLHGVTVNVMVETGVAYGTSTVHLLNYFDKIGEGRLWSVDPGISPHNIVEPHPRWTLVAKRSVDALVEIYKDSGPWDVFLHDSDHGVECQTYEYEMAIRLVKPGGWIFSDDTIWGDWDRPNHEIHRAWDKFVHKYALTPFRIGNIYGAQVPSLWEAPWLPEAAHETAMGMACRAAREYGVTPQYER